MVMDGWGSQNKRGLFFLKRKKVLRRLFLHDVITNLSELHSKLTRPALQPDVTGGRKLPGFTEASEAPPARVYL